MFSISRYLPSVSTFSSSNIKEKLNELTHKVREFVKTYLYLFTTLLYGVAYGAYQTRTLKGAILYGVGYVLVGLFINQVLKILAPSSSQISSLAPSKQFKVGNVWPPSVFIEKNHVEGALKRVIKTLRAIKIKANNHPEISVYDFFNEISEEIEKKKFPLQNVGEITKDLELGLCFGQARTQLQYLTTTYSKNSKEIYAIPVLHKEDVLYYQILQSIEARILAYIVSPNLATGVMFSVYDPSFSHFPRLKDLALEGYTQTAFYIRSIHKLKNLKCSASIASSSSANEYARIFNEEIKDFQPQSSISGWVKVSTKIKLETPSHAIWFQCSDGKFRFQDTIDIFQGFFEFPDQKAFFKGLRDQVNIHPNYKNGQIEMEIFEIEKT